MILEYWRVERRLYRATRHFTVVSKVASSARLEQRENLRWIIFDSLHDIGQIIFFLFKGMLWKLFHKGIFHSLDILVIYEGDLASSCPTPCSVQPQLHNILQVE